jgi:hypothetical protein
MRSFYVRGRELDTATAAAERRGIRTVAPGVDFDTALMLVISHVLER